MISIENVNHRYVSEGRGETVALKDVNLTIKKNEFITVIGPSGCGKTTLMRAVGGLVKPTEGLITIDGARVTGPHQKSAIVFQNFALLPWENVETNVAFGLELPGRAQGRTPRQGAPVHREGGSARLREQVPARAVRRHAAAGGPGPSAGRGGPDPPDGRALRRAGPADPPLHAGGAAQHLAGGPAHGHLRHPRHGGSGAPRRPHRPHVRPAGEDRGAHRRRPSPPAQPRERRAQPRARPAQGVPVGKAAGHARGSGMSTAVADPAKVITPASRTPRVLATPGRRP